MSDYEIELLRYWPNDDEIGDAIRIAHSNAMSFINYLGIKQRQKRIQISNIISDSDGEINEDYEPEILDQIYNFENAALEVKILSGNEKNTEENSDSDSDNSYRNNNECENNSNNDFIKTTEVQYILKNSKSTIIKLPENEPEELIFKENGNLDVQQVLIVRSSHDAFSHSDRIRGIKYSGINLNQNSNDLIDRNYVNHLITQLSSNDNSNLIIHNRNTRWLGRKRIEKINLNQDNVKGIIQNFIILHYFIIRINFFILI